MIIYDKTGNRQYWSEWTEHMQRYIEDLGDVSEEDLEEYMVDFEDYCEYKREHE
jgi:hypothetical protein